MKFRKLSAAALACAALGAGLVSCSSKENEGPSVAPPVSHSPQADGAKPTTSAAPAVDLDNFHGKPPADIRGTLIRASTVCNQVDAPFLASLAAAQTGFNAQATSGELKGMFLLSDESAKRFGFDEDKDGKVDLMSAKDSIMTVARMACSTAGIIDEAALDPNAKTPFHGNPRKALAVSVLYGEEPLANVDKHDGDALMKRWERLYTQYQREGIK